MQDEEELYEIEEDPVEKLLEEDAELAELEDLIESKGIDGIGNAIENAEADPFEVQEMRKEFEARQAALDIAEDHLQEVTMSKVQEHMDKAQQPVDDVLDVVNQLLECRNEAENPLTEEGRLEIEMLKEEITEMQEQQGELAERICAAKRKPHER
ncbi:MAG: hypothetical protein E4H01_03570 [Lysobacterales bacterium]|jgi:hypothetical protein|nr:MAG: hypothetical protein E4H01_03570 [Xanthomonadales bacterium]